MEVRNKQVPATLTWLFAFLLFVSNAFASTYQHYIQQVRRTDGSVMAGAQVRVYLPGTNTPVTIFSNITGTVVKSQPIVSDSNGYFDFFLGDQVVDILIQGNNFPTTKLLNVTLSALATAGVLTVPNGGTGANSFTLDTVLLGNNTLPIKTSSVGLANQVFRVPNAGGQPDFGAINLASSAAVSGVLPPANGGTGSSNGSVLRVREQDGTPDVPNVIEARVTNGTLTDNGGGVVSIDIAASVPPFTDTTAIVKGSIDATKLLRFEVDGFTTGTTRTVTFPNASIVAAATDFLNLWADGIKQTFNPNGTNAGVNIGAHTADPSVGVNGDLFYDSVLNKFRCYENGAWGNCISVGTSPGGANTNVQFNDSGTFGGEAEFVYDKTNKFVGIGSTAALTDEGLSVASAGSHNGVISSQRADADAPPGNSAGFRAYKSRGSIGAPSAVQSGDWMLGLSSNAYDSTGFFGTARAFTEATQTHTASAHGSRWVFSTTPNGSTTITDTFRLPQDGGLQILTGTKPTCDSTKRGYLFRVDGGAGVADTAEICDKDSSDVYAWRSIQGGGSSTPNSIFDPAKNLLIRNYALNGGTALDINDGSPSGLSAVGTASFGSGGAGKFVIQTSAGGGSNRAELNSTATLFQFRWNEGEWATRFLLAPSGTVSDIRTFVGLFLSDPADPASSTPAIDYAMFRYATDVDGTAFWRCASDNSSGTPEVTTTSVAIATNTLYRLRIRWNSGATEFKFFIDDVLVATHSTKVPGNSTLTRYFIGIKELAAAAKSFGVQWVQWWQ